MDCLGKFCDGVQPGESVSMTLDNLAGRRLNEGLFR